MLIIIVFNAFDIAVGDILYVINYMYIKNNKY